MVSPNELVDLDPELEDILSVWGKEPTVQNVERYFGGFEYSKLISVSQGNKVLSQQTGKDHDSFAIQARRQVLQK